MCRPLIFSMLLIQAALAAESTAGNAAAEKLGWTLAVHSYTYQKFSLADAIDQTAATGIRHMSISGGVNIEQGKKVPTASLGQADLDAIRQRLEKAGIAPRFVNMGVVDLPADEAKCRTMFSFAKSQGIGVLVSEPKEGAFDVIDRLCTEFDIKVAIHNHPKPSPYWSPDAVLAAVKGRSPRIGACADIGHWIRSGLDPLACLSKLEGRLIALHFKDVSADAAHHDVPWGTGIGKSYDLLQELKRQRYRGAFCIEYEYNSDNPTPDVTRCARFFFASCLDLSRGMGDVLAQPSDPSQRRGTGTVP